MTAAGLAAASCAQPTPEVIEKEVPVEKVVKETVVVEKEVAVEKVVTATAVVSEYAEAPMLAGKVQGGDLPPVDERLPDEPLVVEPWEEIGEYGGTWHRLAVSAGDIVLNSRVTYENPVRWNLQGTETIPNVLKSWEIQEEGRVYIWNIRKGMKWSDGEPFTADDYMFYFEDHMGNEELTPTAPSFLRPGGEPVEAEKIDDHTIKLTFAVPYGLFLTNVAGSNGLRFAQYPKHYRQQFHPNYVDLDTLNKRAQDEGFEFWYQLYGDRGNNQAVIEMPVIYAWKLIVPPPKQPIVAERNPYYWKVDTEGNQLPYVDRIEWMLVQGKDQVNLRAVAGEVDLQGRHITFENYPLYQENQEQGDYRIVLWKSGRITDSMLQPNISHPDPVMREILGDKRFRWALSLGIRRDEIIEAAYLGTTDPQQISPHPNTPYYWEEQATNMIEYDPDRANSLLDEMGLEERDAEGFRLRPDGDRLTVVYLYAPVFGSWGTIGELLKGYWKDLGIDLVLSEQARQLWSEKRAANELDLTVWTGPNGFNPLGNIRPYICFQSPQAYWQYLSSGGSEGEEPPAFMLEQWDIWNQIEQSVDPQEWQELFRGILEIHMEQMVNIGICSHPPVIFVVKNDFRNFPEDGVEDWQLLSPGASKPEQYFIRGA
jgi:peptide/nickel transport system substrate-binding protein